jgi:hypothetical protein
MSTKNLSDDQINFILFASSNASVEVGICFLQQPEKLTVTQLVNEFLVFYGIQKFVTAFTTARHLPLS